MNTITVTKTEGVNLSNLNQQLESLYDGVFFGLAWDNTRKQLSIYLDGATSQQAAEIVQAVADHDPSVQTQDQINTADRMAAYEQLRDQAESAFETLSQQSDNIAIEIAAIKASSLPQAQKDELVNILNRQNWNTLAFSKIIKTILLLARQLV